MSNHISWTPSILLRSLATSTTSEAETKGLPILLPRQCRMYFGCSPLHSTVSALARASGRGHLTLLLFGFPHYHYANLTVCLASMCRDNKVI